MDALVKLLRAGYKSNAVKTIVIGKAVNVQGNKFDLERYQAPTIYDVRINAVVDTLNSSFTITPKNNSYVVVGILEGVQEEAVLLSCSELEKVAIKLNNTQLFIDYNKVELLSGSSKVKVSSNGVTIEKGNDNLADLIGKVIDEVNKINPSTPPNVPLLISYKTRIQNVLQL